MSGTKGTETPLFVHEQSLADKVGKDSEAGQFVDQQELLVGLQLVTHLTILLRVARSHGIENRALDRPIEGLRAGIQALGSTRPVELSSFAGFVFLWDRHLKATTAQLPIVSGFLELTSRLGIGSIVVENTVTPDELKAFALACAQAEGGESALELLEGRLQAAGVRSITLRPPRPAALDDEVGETMRGDDRAEGPAGTSETSGATPGPGGPGTSDAPPGRASPKRHGVRERARGAYGRAASAVDAMDRSARTGGALSFRQARRAIQNIVDVLRADESTVLGLTTLRAHDEYTHNHSVNVAVLAMALGNRAGYPKRDLADLGLAALFHDVGKCAIPLPVLNKEEALDPDDWQVMRTHPSEGVVTLIRQRGLDAIPARMAASSFEHHLGHDGLGYPSLGPTWKQTVSSRIISIADCYDAMTSARVYRRDPASPAEALAYIRGRAGAAFDPVLVKYFVTSVGIVPIGSLVTLGDGRLAVVTRPAASKENALYPPVRVVADAEGRPVRNAPELDLSDPDVAAETGGIRQLVDNTEWHLETTRWVA